MTHEKLLTAAEIAAKLEHVAPDTVVTWADTDRDGVPATTGIIDILDDGAAEVLTVRRQLAPSGSPDWDEWLQTGHDPDYFAFLDAVADGRVGPPPVVRPSADA